jgi:hypothetical protein
MKSKFIIIISSCLVTLASCGPNPEQKATLEKEIIDSITKATEKATILKIEAKNAIQDSIRNIRNEIEMLEIEISNMEAELEVAKDRMGQIKEWQFGRTASEREEQIRSQTIEIIDDQKQISFLKKYKKKRENKLEDSKRELKQYQ